MRFSNHVLNEFVAPGLAEFTIAEIPDLRLQFPQAQHWVGNHLLNSVFRARFKHGMRQLVIGYLRRSSRSFNAYHRAREISAKYIEAHSKGAQPIKKYYSAVNSWEEFVLQSGMALDLFRHINCGDGSFKKNDGSPEQRLYTIANQVKHTASCVASGQCTEKNTIPLWLSNNGLKSFGISITFIEAASVLADVSRLADGLQDPHPSTGAGASNGESTDQNA
jgi:hypothetical protein